LWAISLLPELVGGIHAFAWRAGKPVFAFLPRRIAIVERPHFDRPVAASRRDFVHGRIVRRKRLLAGRQSGFMHPSPRRLRPWKASVRLPRAVALRSAAWAQELAAG
jgi:hypothetical protein